MSDMDLETRFIAHLLSGSLLMGSAIAYPILYQDRSQWASVALCTFFLSGTTFNGLQIYKILKYGHYTIVVCVVGSILNMAFGHNTLVEHAHFIPVYAMGCSFVTAAWPSLEESWSRARSHGHWGYLPTTVETSEQRPRYMPMGRYGAEPESPAAPGASFPSWPRDQSREGGSPPPFSPTPSLVGDRFGPDPSMHTWLQGIRDMEPASHRSQPDRAHTDTSISLSSRPTVPSEVSTNARELLGPVDSARVPRSTQRRLDIDSLGRIRPPPEVSPSSA